MNKQKNKLKVLVLGGNGFIGSQIVANLKDKADVFVGTRCGKKQESQLTVRMQEMRTVRAWKTVLEDFDVIVNSVGILRERKGESYNVVHHVAVATLAQACAVANIRLLHVSAIGLSANARSRFIQSKFAGEQAIIASGARATIVRPSLLDGEGGYGAKWFRRVATWPVQFVMKSEGLIAPLQESDLGEAMANLVLKPESSQQTFIELGGTDAYSIPAYLTRLRQAKGYAPALQIPVPKGVVRLTSHIFDWFAWTPLSFGHFELMQGYNVPSINLLPQLLRRNPMSLGEESGELFKGEAVILKS